MIDILAKSQQFQQYYSKTHRFKPNNIVFY